MGAEYKPLYENFRNTYNIGANGIASGQLGKFSTVEIDFSQAAVFADTYTPLSYQQDGLYALDSEANPQVVGTSGAASPGTAALLVAATRTIAATGVTASIPLGQSVAVGRNDGSVELWTDGQRQLLHDAGWGSPVRYILDYGRPLKDDQGNTLASSFTGSVDGTSLTVTTLGAGSSVMLGQAITGEGIAAGTTVTKFIPTAGGEVGADGGPGTYEVSISQTVATTKITQPSIAAVAPGFVVGLGNGSVQLWSATTGWIELHDSGWGSGVSAISTYGEGIVVGLTNGSVQKWNGPAGPQPSGWTNNWTELQNNAWGQPVSAIVEHGAPGSPDYGIVVALGGPPTADFNPPGAVEFWDPSSGWTELQGTGWKSGVTAMTAYGDGVAVGLSNGSVQYWDGTIGFHQGFHELQGTGWGQQVSTMVTFKTGYGKGAVDGLIVGLGGPPTTDFNPPGAVELYTGGADFKSGSWIELHDTGWKQPVTSMITYNSASTRPGVVVGLGNGSVQLWNGTTSGQNQWTELHDSGWGSGIASLIPLRQTVTDAEGNVVARDGLVVGLDNGALEQWTGLITSGTGQNDWTEIDGPSRNQAAQTLAEDGVLEAAITFGKALAGAGGAPAWGAPNSVGGTDDPLFSQSYFQAASTATGSYLPITSYIPASLVKATLTDPLVDASVDLSYDVNAIAYGYAFVPDGALAKLVPGKWSVAMLLGLETGPSLTVNLGEGGTINIPDQNLFNYQYFTPGPLGFDTFAIDVGANAALTATLIGASDTLNAHAYMVPGMLFTYNTNSSPKAVQIGFNAYPDVDYSDFTKVTGVSVTPTLTPYVTASYGIFAPDAYPIVGGWSLFSLSMGYENPVSATVAVEKDTGASLTLESAGFITAHAGILDSLTSLMSWDGEFLAYDVSRTF